MGENMSKTEMHQVGLWAAFFNAMRDYRDFLQDAVDRGVDAKSAEGKAVAWRKKKQRKSFSFACQYLSKSLG